MGAERLIAGEKNKLSEPISGANVAGKESGQQESSVKPGFAATYD